MIKLRPVANFLAHQPANDSGTNQKGNKKTRQRSSDRTEQNVFVGVESKQGPVSDRVVQMP